METSPVTVLLEVFDFAFDQKKKKTGKPPEGYRNFFRIIAQSLPGSIEYRSVVKETHRQKEEKGLIPEEEKALTTKERQHLISNLQKQKRTINESLESVYGSRTVYIDNKRGRAWQLIISDKFCEMLRGKSNIIDVEACLKEWQATKGKPKKKSRSTMGGQLRNVSHSELIQCFHLRRRGIIARIHKDFAIELDERTRTTLDSLNVQRRSRGRIPYYSAPRFRLIRPPTVNDSEVILDLVPIDFACFVMLRDEDVPDEVKNHIRNRIQDIASCIPQSLQTTDRTLNARNPVPLGTQIVILTRDGKTLMRKRGESVLVSAGDWSMAFGGHCGNDDLVDEDGTELDVGLTVENELRTEIGTLSADPRGILFTGLHRNKKTGSISILGFWKLEAGVDELASLLTDKYPGEMEVFKTTKRADERFVLECENLIVDFNARDISKALEKAGSSVSNLIPECLVALILALDARGLSTSELFF